MGTGFSKQKKQAKMLQEQLAKMQDQFKATEVTGVAANGLITVSLNGDHEITKLKIKPECVDPEDVEGLEDLIKQAFKNANDQLKNASMPEIPGMPDLSQFGL